MTQPSIVVRACGAPIAAIPLVLGGMWLMFAWTQGRASVWLALAGCFITTKTMSCVRRRKRYNAWRRQWDAVGTFGKARPRRPIDALRLVSVLALVLFIGIFTFCEQLAADNPQLQDGLTWLWLLSAVFLAARFGIGLKNLLVKLRDRKGKSAKTEVAPVSWMLSTTLDSPSRQAAVRNLPEYARRILHRSELRVDMNM